MRISFIFSIIIAIATTSNAAPNDLIRIKSGFLTGNSYRELSDMAKRGYVMGYVEGLFISPLIGAPKSGTLWLENCITGMTENQLIAILDRWLSENPVRWHEQMSTLTYGALRQSCQK